MSRARQLHFTTLVLSFSLVVSMMSLTLLGSRGAFSDTTDNTGNSFASSNCFGASPDSVQTGTATSSANGAVSVSITAVDPTLSFLMFSSRHDSNRPVGSMIRGRLNATGDAVEFERVTDEVTPVTMTMEWYVVTYACGITVQRGEVSQATTTINVPISSVGSTSQAFVTWSKTPVASDGGFGNNDPVVGELTSPTNLQFRVDSANATHIIAWQVIAFDNPGDVNVQTGATSLLGTATSTTATLTPAVDLTKTFVLASYRIAGGGPDIGANMLSAELTNSTTITFTRGISGSPDDITEITWQAIELKEGSSVQRGTQAFSAATTQQNISITPVDTTKAYAFGSMQAGSGQNLGQSNYAADDIVGVGSFTADLSSSQLTLTRDNTAASANVGWFVVHWGSCSTPTWWNPAYEHRAKITVSAGSDSVTTGYSVGVAVDHAQMVADGKSLASGADLRVLHWDGSDCTWSELDRVLQEGSGWGVADTTLWFSLQANIAVSTDDANYYLYYDNPVAASPPADKTAVYAVWDDFDDSSLGSGWTLDAIGSVVGGTVSESGTVVRISAINTGDIWGTADDLYHLARNVSGDFLAESYTTAVGGTHGGWSKYGGVHLRDSSTDDSVNRNMSEIYTSAGSTNSYRLVTGGTTAEQLGQRYDYNRLTRVGDSSRAFNSADGIAWGEIGTSVNFTSGLSDPVRIGPILSALSSSPHWVEIDWFKVRLYVDDEPTTATGTEEMKP